MSEAVGKRNETSDPPKSEDVPMSSPTNANGDTTTAPSTEAAGSSSGTAAPEVSEVSEVSEPSASTSATIKKKILLGYDDAEADDEEEDVDMDIDTTTTPTPTFASTAAGVYHPSHQNQQANITALIPPTSNATSTPTTTPPTGGPTYVIPKTKSNQLISQIISPSPFQHHNDSATSDRYRSALQRVTTSPLHDVEAWEAIMTECMSLYRTQLLPRMEEERTHFKFMVLNNNNNNGNNGSTTAAGSGFYYGRGPSMTTTATATATTTMTKMINVELEQKLDWVESCHGHLLHYFPYTASYYVSVLEVLLARGALPFESYTGGEDDYSFGASIQHYLDCTNVQRVADDKANCIFESILGVKMDGSPVTAATTATDESHATSGDENDNDDEQKDEQGPSISESQALLGGMCTSSVELWQLFIRKRSRDAKREALRKHSEQQQQPQQQQHQNAKITPQGEDLIRDWIIGAYEVALNNGAAFVHNNDVIWKAYLGYVKSWNVMTTNPMNSTEVTINHMLHSKQKELLRSIYQRIVQLPMTGLDSLWTEYELYEKAQSEQLATALIGEFMPKYQHARSVYLERNRVFNIRELQMGKVATPPADISGSTSIKNTKEENKAAIIEEIKLLSKWKRRCAYERTNPERLSNADLAVRVRQCFKDTVCAFMRHIEVWHEWSMWELLTAAGTSSGTAAAAGASTSTNGKKRNIQYATSVLTLAQIHIPDCTLLAYANAQILENQVGDGSTNSADEAIDVMRTFCDRAGNTLGYVLLQRLVRKYRGVNEARKVFATARRELRTRPEDHSGYKAVKSTSDNTGNSNVKDVTKAAGETGADVSNQDDTEDTKKNLVMTRESFGKKESTTASLQAKSLTDGITKNKNGFITWHLYAHHASIEHRVNQLPQVAAKVFELGLRKHRTFLATPQYVLQYCSLLLELGDEENLRALLTRSIAACEDECDEQSDGVVGGTANASKSATQLGKREKQRPLWDMMLRFESIVSARSGDQTSLREIEAKRRNALFGSESEDVSGGNFLEQSDVGIGVQKISLSDTLIRTDGYDVSSKIINGLDRMVDMLEISGILSDESRAQLFGLGVVWKDDGAGGVSDASFRRRKGLETERLILSELAASGSEFFRSASLGGGLAVSSTGKLLSAKERLAQSAFQNQNQPLAAAILASPEWLRGMLQLLPATARNYRGAKAPPHMIEMALAALRDNSLPSVRPSGSQTTEKNNSSKRKRLVDGDSSDEENGSSRGGGYGNQFKARQRAKLMPNAGTS